MKATLAFVLGNARQGKVDFVVGMLLSTQIAGILSAVVVLIVIVALGFLLEPLQKVTHPLWMLSLSPLGDESRTLVSKLWKHKPNRKMK